MRTVIAATFILIMMIIIMVCVIIVILFISLGMFFDLSFVNGCFYLNDDDDDVPWLEL